MRATARELRQEYRRSLDRFHALFSYSTWLVRHFGQVVAADLHRVVDGPRERLFLLVEERLRPVGLGRADNLLPVDGLFAQRHGSRILAIGATLRKILHVQRNDAILVL